MSAIDTMTDADLDEKIAELRAEIAQWRREADEQERRLIALETKFFGGTR